MRIPLAPATLLIAWHWPGSLQHAKFPLLMRDFWEARYSESQFAYGTAPNGFLVECEPLLPRGANLLVPGDGEGRNGAWLASRGHVVTSLDLAESGLKKARALAASMGVPMDTVCADV
jgi:2-polyprenyl-3-methyl-5-hydroxy-6-metoxy-1,4-benzoquinol methylase